MKLNVRLIELKDNSHLFFNPSLPLPLKITNLYTHLVILSNLLMREGDSSFHSE